MSMGRIISVLTVLITVAAGAQTERRLYRPSSIAMEARLAFTAEVEIESSREPNDLEKKQSVEGQIQHLHGSLAALPQRPSYSEIPNQAFPLSGHTFRITSTKRVSPGIYTVTYNFEGTVFTRTRAEKIPVILPLNPKKIYQQTLGGSRSINRCTHPYFNTEGDFWLFWNSNWAECKIRREHLVERVGSLTHVPPVTISYPEY